MLLTDSDQAMLEGSAGGAVALAMELIVTTGEAMKAPALLDISGAHIDGCLYHGQAGLDFARLLGDLGGKVTVPTTLNVSSLDLLHPDLYRGDAESALAARELMDIYVEMGCMPSWTCAPYQLADRPRFGEQIAWGESNAIVFANSVIGARTARYGDFLDICCAITGRAPQSELHTEEGRRATLVLDLEVPDHVLDSEILYPVLGHLLGQIAGSEIAAITGLDDRATEDRLKALGAAAASSGAVGMFHVVGVTPEAATLEAAVGKGRTLRRITVGVGELTRARKSLGVGSGELGAVSVGTPHFSAGELEELADLVTGRRSSVPFYVNTSREILASAERQGFVAPIETFGATLVTDTCTYITPIMGQVDGLVMTNSGKWAFYAPGNLGMDVVFASLAECVESAVGGKVTTGESW